MEIIADFTEYSVRQAAKYLTKKLRDSYGVEDVESHIGEGNLIFCVYSDDRLRDFDIYSFGYRKNKGFVIGDFSEVLG